MDQRTVLRWKRCEKLAAKYSFMIYLLEEDEEGFGLVDKHGQNLGEFETVAELLAFLHGYGHKCEE